MKNVCVLGRIVHQSLGTREVLFALKLTAAFFIAVTTGRDSPTPEEEADGEQGIIAAGKIERGSRR